MTDLRPGDYIALDSMPDEPDPLPIGSRGYVTQVSKLIEGVAARPFVQFTVKWDCGRSLILCVPPDRAHVVRRAGDLTDEQERALRDLCRRYHVNYDAADYGTQFDLPPGYVAGWLGGIAGHQGPNGPTIYVGVSAAGEVSS